MTFVLPLIRTLLPFETSRVCIERVSLFFLLLSTAWHFQAGEGERKMPALLFFFLNSAVHHTAVTCSTEITAARCPYIAGRPLCPHRAVSRSAG